MNSHKMSAIKLMDIKEQLSQLLMLGSPLIVTRILESLKDFVNILLLARLGAQELAAGGLITLFFATLMMIFWGIFSATSTIVSHHHGAEQPNLIGHAVKNGLWLSIFLSVPIMLLIWYGGELLRFFGQPPATIRLANSYSHVLAWAVLPDFLGIVLSNFYIGIAKPRIMFLLSLIYVPFNIAMSYISVFGKWGVPPQGVAGIGWGTLITYWLAFFMMLGIILLNKEYRRYFQIAMSPQWTMIKELLAIGLPMGMMWTVEITFFMVISICVGYLGTVALAAHQIACQLLSFAFTFVNAMTQAITVQVGHAMGQKQLDKLAASCIAGLIISTVYMFVIALGYWFIPEKIVAIDLDLTKPENTQVLLVAVKILAFAAIYEIIDASRFAIYGVLRGMKDTQFSMYVSLIGYWLFALPLGYLMVFKLHWFGPEGFWLAMAFGMSASLAAQAMRLQNKFAYVRNQLIRND